MRTSRDAEAVSSRVLLAARSCGLPPGQDLVVSASIGLAVTDSSRASPEDLVLAADQAMYAAKGSGGDSYRMCEPGA